MITMDNWATKAVDKLASERNTISDKREKVMAPAVLETLKTFCLQDQEFAQAVAQGGSFSACMKAVADGVGNSISDLDAYKRAVQFYFPGAQIRMQMTIDLIGDAAQPELPKNEGESIVLDLMKLL